MTDRERLTALLMVGAGNFIKKNGALNCTKLADYLFEHGVTVPPADVVEVVRGRWIKRQFVDEPTAYGYRCSECHLTYEVDTNYCPNCGARMDGDTE